MKVALILCPSWDRIYPTFGLASLAASLRSAGHEASIYDLNKAFALLEQAARGRHRRLQPAALSSWFDADFVRRQAQEHRRWLESTVDKILGQGHRVVGFSVFGTNRLMTLEVARLFKRRDSKTIVVAGGPECLFFSKAGELARQDGVDAVVYGEGEQAFPDLIDDLERSGKLRAGPGVLLSAEPSSWKDERAPIADLETLPFADYEAHRFKTFSKKVVNTTRGCVRACDFCMEWRPMPLRQMSASRLRRELEHQLSRHRHIRDFMFGDSLVNGSMARLEEFCGLMERAPLDLRWQGYAIVRPEMKPAILGRLRGSGCEALFFGIESGSERVRRAMGKGFPDDLASRVLRDSAAAGIAVRIGIFTGHPAETEEDFERTLSFVAANAGAIARLGLGTFMPPDGEASPPSWSQQAPALYRASPDGSSTFPIRLQRVRRLLDAARDHGITAWFQGAESHGECQALCDEMLEGYERWERAACLPA